MKDVYEFCPEFESDKWLLRFVKKEDAPDLLAVYGDKNALPFFNSDNCHGDNFYYNTKEKMDKAIDFWLFSYEQKYFVRWAIIDKTSGKAVGTIELFHRPAGVDFGDVGLIRLDLASGYEKAEPLREILSLIIPPRLRAVRLRGDNLQGSALRGGTCRGVRGLRFHEDRHLPGRRE